MVLILDSCGGRKVVLADIVQEAQSVGIKGIGLRYSEKKESIHDYESNLGNLLYLNPFSKRNIDDLKERLNELICVRSYTSASESTWYDSSGRGGGRVKNSEFLRHYKGVSQSWKILHVDVSKDDYCDGEGIPMLHSLLRVLERFRPIGVKEAQIWLETSKRIRNGFYLSGLKKELTISHFEGWSKFMTSLSKNNNLDPKEGDFYKGTYFIQKMHPNGLDPFSGGANVDDKFTVYCAIDEYPSFYKDFEEKIPVKKDSFLWAVDKIKKMQATYEQILSIHKKTIDRSIRNIL